MNEITCATECSKQSEQMGKTAHRKVREGQGNSPGMEKETGRKGKKLQRQNEGGGA